MTALAIAAGVVPVLLAAYVLLLAPGQAWWRGRASAAPRLYVRVVLSVAWTTALGLGLIVVDSFSLPRLIVINAATALVGYLWIGRVRIDGVALIETGRASALVALLALCAYWPPFEVHVGASDATTYVDAGVHLARTHSLAKPDPVGAAIAPFVGVTLFDSIFGGGWKAPYHRIPGGMIILRHAADTAYPTFFPAPIVWSAVFADAFGARHAGGYAALFCALAVWGCWWIARKRLGFAATAVTTALVTVNAAAFWAARMPLSEPLAWAFLWAGLVAYDAWEEEGFAADARLSGAMFGAAALIRLELAAFLAVAFAAVYLFGNGSGLRRPTVGFYTMFVAVVGGSFAAVYGIPGGYAAPFFDGFRSIQFLTWLAWQSQPVFLLAAAAIAATLAAWSVKRRGLAWTLAAGLLAGGVLGYWRTSRFEALRSLQWLGGYLGWATLPLAAAGAWTAWTRRHARPADTFFVLLFGVFALFLIYDPHVMPIMPWGSRRYVPVVIPAALILAAMAAARIGARSMIAGAVAWLVLTVSVMAPARFVLTHDFFRGTYDQLAEFEGILPDKGTFLLDEGLRSLVLGVPMWLLFDRENVLMTSAGRRAEKLLTGFSYSLFAEHGPIYLIQSSFQRAPKPSRVTVTPVDSFVFSFEVPVNDDSKPPQQRHKYPVALSVYELMPAPFGPPPAQTPKRKPAASFPKPPAAPQASE